MLIQISSGLGSPQECEMACCLYLKELLKEFKTMQIVSTNYRNDKCLKSAVLYSDDDLSFLEGTVQWICQSLIRPHHKRKNWFICVSILKDEITIDNNQDIKYEVFRSSGKGGQNVNKVSTAIRAIHIPTGLSVVCMDQRNQPQNKKIAYLRLLEKIDEHNSSINGKIKYYNWNLHNQIIRGNPNRIYKGIQFKRIK
ncbi:peptide chain release factor H [Clostridium sp. AUH-JLR23]|uniref:peptide chain release factor H n=1 Tax=Clostridium sp. AUH-JLR23 TaxID=1505062 RepID=UPI00356847B4